MKHHNSRSVVLAALIVVLSGSTASAISIDMVTVGNPGNAPDTRYNNISVGSVPYIYQIGKFEVTAGEYTEFLNAVATTSDTYRLYNANMSTAWGACRITQGGTSGNYTYSVASDWANRPVNSVSWGSAARFANWLTNGQPTGAQGLSTTEDGSYYLNGATSQSALMAVTRKANATWVIPTEDEWYKAAYHKNDGATGNYWDYPTGTNSMPGRDMTEATNPGNNANYSSNLSYLIGSPYYRTPVDEFELSHSPHGTFDQGGNVWEWNETAGSSSSRVLRGGSYYYFYSYSMLASYRIVNGNPTGELSSNPPYTYYNEVGFRVASVPEPGSIALLVAGVISLLAYVWRRRWVACRHDRVPSGWRRVGME